VIPWDFIWVEGGKGKRIENFYRSVDASFHLPNCCGPLWGGEFIAQIELFMLLLINTKRLKFNTTQYHFLSECLILSL
jgi:hypothetical protein